MEVSFTQRADKDYARLSPRIRLALGKQLAYLLINLQHPSLHAKKYDQANNLWQGRVNRSWRFYFAIRGDEYVVLAIIPHPK